MCLPSILDVADRAGLSINPRTRDKKEVYAICPFCNDGRFKLSMNTEYNVFKCWLCQEKGGVLDLESKLTGVPFNEVKKKYFKVRKNQHPVEYLNPNQLKKIGWNEIKRRERETFKKKRDEVLNDWKRFELDQKKLHFSMLMVVAHLEGQNERQSKLLEYILKSAQETGIYLLFSTLMQEYVKEADERSEWAKEAVLTARSAWRVSLQTCDFDMANVMKHVVFMHHLSKMDISQPTVTELLVAEG